jgi:hypothetical protein
MPTQNWLIDIPTGQHAIRLVRSDLTGWTDVFVNGEKLVKSQLERRRRGRELVFEKDDVRYVATLKSSFASGSFELNVNGNNVLTDNPVPPLPKWSWIFIAACVAIPIVSLGGAIPAAVGVGGAYAVSAIARDSSMSVAERAVISLGIVVACWIAIFLVLGATARLISR